MDAHNIPNNFLVSRDDEEINAASFFHSFVLRDEKKEGEQCEFPNKQN